MTRPLGRSVLRSAPSYRAGARAEGLAGLTPYKLSSNEMPHAPLPSVARALDAATQEVNRYPDPASTELRSAIADFHQVEPDNIAVATGAVALCYQVALSTAVADIGSQGDGLAGNPAEIVFAWRSFEAYPIVAAVAGARPRPIPLRDGFSHDLSAMAAAINERTRVVFVCSPNNPTGTVVSAAEFDHFMHQVPPHVVVVLDEAYGEYCRDRQAVTGGRLFEKWPNLLALRTFSKAYGLAGLRVGYAVGNTELVEVVNASALPFGVSGPASAAAVASLAAAAELGERVEATVADRSALVVGLRERGWNVPDTEANFVWLPVGEYTEQLVAACDARALAVRGFPGEGIRVTVGEPEAVARFLATIDEFTDHVMTRGASLHSRVTKG